jgi:hypothetical protein
MMNMADEFEQQDRYIHLKSGALYDRQAGRIVAHSGEGEYQITKANAHAMLERKRAKGRRSKLRGMARGAGFDIDPNATDEDLEIKAADALELYVAHLGKTFLKSENLRGMGETFSRLTEPFAMREDTGELTPGELHVSIRGMVETFERLIHGGQIENTDNGDVIDAEQITGGDPAKGEE